MGNSLMKKSPGSETLSCTLQTVLLVGIFQCFNNVAD